MSAIADQAYGNGDTDEDNEKVRNSWPNNPNAPRPKSEYTDLNEDLKAIREYTGSAVIEKPLEEVSDEIASKIPDIRLMANKIRRTKGYQESKELVHNFKEKLADLDPADLPKPLPIVEHEKEGTGLEIATEKIFMVVRFMRMAGIPVPEPYIELLQKVCPKEYNEEIEIIKSKPSFKIVGADPVEGVQVDVNAPLEIKKGKTKIVLDGERLKRTLIESQKVNPKSVREMDSFIKKRMAEKNMTMQSDDMDAIDLNDLLDSLKDDDVNEGEIEEIISELEQELEQPVQISRKVEEKPMRELPPINIQSVNKNAYELRHLILENSINVVNEYKNDLTLQNRIDMIMSVAERFYSFVENKKHYGKSN